MNPERLVDMLNDIAANLGVEPDREEALAAIVAHLRRFWEPGMRRQLLAYVDGGGAGLETLALEAAQRLRQASVT
ncbi:formate dehydrogenase subunit delta [Tahibacter amnicola]|uniref:Formate dehydrogenase subunit delta n=1 Tax=Tahibacter amnicola TaxID=2976241 RepID=A0ABY6BCU5_9GAMM|nr:formate dehydrogenase subunit delta [Tahibacter amnicola]UXI67863.1 formate dehydrogenase subunit delta [Tahibacter amnicola]